MKRLAETGGLVRDSNYYIAPCDRCGLMVVHSIRVGVLHMHKYSKKCATLAAKRDAAEKAGKR